MTRVGIIADIHMRTSVAERLAEELRNIGDRFEEQFKPDHVFVLGDIIQDGSSGSEDERNLQRVHDVLSAYSFSTTYLLGNHDVINLPRRDIADILYQDSFFGTVTVGKYTFIYLDSSLRETATPGGMVGPDQLSYVEETLSRGDITFVLVHHPVGDFDLSENYWVADYPEQAYLLDRKRLLEILSGDVVATISGHIHQQGVTDFRDVRHVSLNAFSKETPDRPFTGTFAELRVGETTVAEIRDRDGVTGRYGFQRRTIE